MKRENALVVIYFFGELYNLSFLFAGVGNSVKAIFGCFFAIA